MSRRSSDEPRRGFGRSEPGREVRPAETTVDAANEEPAGTVEIPLGTPGDFGTLAELKRRAEEPDPAPMDDDEPQDCSPPPTRKP